MTGEEAKRLWADPDERELFWWVDYGQLIAHMGQVVAQHDEGSYQGDTFVVLRAAGRVGYLEFGWGSCSGCDALMACRSWDDVANLYDELVDDILWFDSDSACAEWLREHDWDGAYNADAALAFVPAFLEALS